jgi:7,8-dihydro-6-hydroxymethylpterin dimethyltransferase
VKAFETAVRTETKDAALRGKTVPAGEPAGTASVEETLFRAGVKFNPVEAGLPLRVESQCLECERVIQGVMVAKGGAVFIEKQCPEHGWMEERLQDALFAGPDPSDPAAAGQCTRTGAKIRPVVRTLPKTVETLCPECGRLIIGRVFDWRGDVYQEKTCPEHGYCKDRVTTNTKLYLKCQQWAFQEGRGLENPQVSDATRCPFECGICNMHQSHTLLGQIDLTNRCNLACPICFASSNTSGYIYEPDFDEIRGMLENLRSYRPTPASAVQFSGGEPTIHPDFLRIVATARDLGFSHIQIASNGLTLAEPGFAEQCAEAGLHTVYLQFDGVDDEVYEFTRGRKLFDVKRKALENIHRAGMKVCLVPTIVKGVNDDQVPKILRFAIENIHVVSAIAYQPVSFTGRISREDRERQRYTLGDLANDLSATGLTEVDRDFYPLALVAPFSRLMAAVTGHPKITATSHPCCSSGTYFVIDPDRNAVPITRFLDVEGLFTEMEDLAGKIERSRFPFFQKLKVTGLFKKYFNEKAAPPGMNVKTFLYTLKGLTDKGTGRGKAGEKTYRTLMAAAMHFQDRYNYDVERVKRCVIHYSTPEGIFPFCAYNSGPVHRERIERKHSLSLEEWKARRKRAVSLNEWKAVRANR